MALRRARPCLGARGLRLLLGCLPLLCFWRCASALPGVDELQFGITVNPNCSTVDGAVTAALGQTDGASVWRLGSGCSRLQQNFVCNPINDSITIDGAPDGSSVWDMEFDLYQFSAEPGVTVTIRNMTLARALVFTVGYGNMQLSLLHMRPGSRLVLQNVVVRTLCSTVRFYYSALDESVRQALQPPANSSAQQQGQSFVISSLAVGGVVLQNVTFCCNAAITLPTNTDLVVHGAAMLTSFVAATSSLTLPATIHLAENITLPAITSPYNPDAPDARVGVVTSDITIESLDDATGGDGMGLMYVDANHTAAWMYVQPPAKLTLRRMVLTRLRTNIWSPGVMDGVLAGATPVFMVQAPGAGAAPQQAPGRLFVDVVLVVPAYEVTQMSYWCIMVGAMVPELTWAADFLRSLVWQSDCDVLGRDAVFFRRVRTTATSYTRVRLTSAPPPGVPADPAGVPLPEGASAYPHVTPPLHFASSVEELADAVAPLQPQDYLPSPPPGAADLYSNSSSIVTTGRGAQLPVVVLVNGSLSLTAAAFRAPGGGPRVVRRSVLITPMRRGCSASGANGTISPTGDQPPCTRALIDLGNIMDALRLEGPNTTVVFEGVTLRNASTTLSMASAFPGRDTSVRGFFIFNRAEQPRIIFDGVTLELTAAAFSDLYRALSTAPRGVIPGGVELYYMNSTLIQLASFRIAGGRGSWVNVTIMPEELAKVQVNGSSISSGGAGAGGSVGAGILTNASVPGGDVPASAPVSAARGGGGSSSDATTAVIVGAVLGGVVAMLVAVVGVFLVRRHLRRQDDEEGKPVGGKGTAEVQAAGLPTSHVGGGGLDSSGSSGTGRGTTSAAPVSGASGDVELGCMSTVAATPAVAAAAEAAAAAAGASAGGSPAKLHQARAQTHRARGTPSHADDADCGATGTMSLPRTADTSAIDSAEVVSAPPPRTAEPAMPSPGPAHPGGGSGGLDRGGEDSFTRPPSSIPEVGEGGEMEGEDSQRKDEAGAAADEARRSSGAVAGPRLSHPRASSVPSGGAPGMLRSMSVARGRLAARAAAAAAAAAVANASASAGGRTSNAACDDGMSELPTTTRSLASDHSGFVSLVAGSSVMTDTVQSGVGPVVPGLLDPPTQEGPATTGSIGGGGRAGMAPLRTRRRGGGAGTGVTPSTPGSSGVRVGGRRLLSGVAGLGSTGGASVGGSGGAPAGVIVGGMTSSVTPRSSSSGLGSDVRLSATEQLPAAPKSTGAIGSPGMMVREAGKRTSDVHGSGSAAVLLPVPQPALLMSPGDSGMLGPGSGGGGGLHRYAGGAVSANGGRAARSAYRVHNTNPRNSHNNRRESSYPALLMSGSGVGSTAAGGAGGAATGAAAGGSELCDAMMSSAQLTAQTFGLGGGGGGGPHSSNAYLDVDGGSPGFSAPMGHLGPMSSATASALALAAGGGGGAMGPGAGLGSMNSSMAEPASEVARLISELAGHTAEQLVILEPIGQGGYGTVYKGLWRNLDVAVKTVLFQDRQANVTTPAGTPGLSNSTALLCSRTQPHLVTTGTAPATVIEEEDLEDQELESDQGHGHEHQHYHGHGYGHGSVGGGGGGGGATGNSRRLSADMARPHSHAASTGTPTHASLAHFAAGGYADRNSASVPLHRVPGAGAPPTSRAGSSQSVHCGFLSPSTTGLGGGGGSLHGGAGGSTTNNSGNLPVINVAISHLHPGSQYPGAPQNTPAAGVAAAQQQQQQQGVASQQRAVLEAAVSCSVTHPNVVATYHYDITPIRPAAVVCSGGLQVADAQAASRAAMAGGGGVTDWKLYLVQEFCDAGSLANALDRRLFHDAAAMPNLALTLCVLADIARGMAHIHTRSIVHGDLNPTNILLRSVGTAGGAGNTTGGGSAASQLPRAPTSGSALGTGPGGCNSGCATPGGSNAGAAGANQLRADLGVGLVAKIADFGLCGMLAPGKRHISNALRGTPFYTSPETVATGTLTKASDVYSFGVIAWEVYTGRPPFKHSPESGFVRDDIFPRLPPHVPPTFANLTLACLSPDPDQRPTFDQILDRIVQLKSKLAQSLQQRLSRLVASHGALPGLSPGALVAAASASVGPGSVGASGAGGSGMMVPASAMSPVTGAGAGGSAAGVAPGLPGGSAVAPGSAAGLLGVGLGAGLGGGLGGSGQHTPLFGPSIYTAGNGSLAGGGGSTWMSTGSGFGLVGGGAGLGGGLMVGTGGGGGGAGGAMLSTNSYGYAQAGGSYSGHPAGAAGGNGGSSSSFGPIGIMGAGGGTNGGFVLPLNAATALPSHVSPPMLASHGAGGGGGGTGMSVGGLTGSGSGGGMAVGMGVLSGFPTYSANAAILGVPPIFPHLHHQQQPQQQPQQHQ